MRCSRLHNDTANHTAPMHAARLAPLYQRAKCDCTVRRWVSATKVSAASADPAIEGLALLALEEESVHVRLSLACEHKALATAGAHPECCPRDRWALL